MIRNMKIKNSIAIGFLGVSFSGVFQGNLIDNYDLTYNRHYMQFENRNNIFPSLPDDQTRLFSTENIFNTITISTSAGLYNIDTVKTAI